MKLFSNIPSRSRRKNTSAFTLIETMISISVYLVVFIGVMVAIQIFALRIYTLAATKLSATEYGRKALDQIRDDIRQGTMLQVGNVPASGNLSQFSPITNSSVAQGDALQIYYTTNLGASYSIYYLDQSIPGTNYLKQYTINSSGVSTTNILVGYITNTIVFDAEDYLGNVVTNNPKNNQVYRMTLQFYQWEYPIGFIGGHGFNAYDYYQLRTKVSRRAIGVGN
jgi:type II secretory pathway pseudopilin PulG